MGLSLASNLKYSTYAAICGTYNTQRNGKFVRKGKGLDIKALKLGSNNIKDLYILSILLV